MNAPNGNEKETRLVRRTENPGKRLADTDDGRSLGSNGDADECKSLRSDRANDPAERVFGIVKRTEAIIGGTISHLITEYRDQLASKKSEMERLETKIGELELLLQDLKRELTEENS
jgi:hypothetical protein